MNKKHSIVYLHKIGFSQKDLYEHIQNLDDAIDIFSQIERGYLLSLGFGSEKIEKILENYSKLEIQKVDSLLEKLKVQLVTPFDPEYPEGLHHIAHPPFLLYIRGTLPSREMFAVVGSRKMSSYGKKCIEKIVPGISHLFCIVSGGALGCDTYAHKAALHSGGNTLVVFGTGIESSYPSSHASFFEEIIQSGKGACLSIFPLGEEAFPYNFPIRNEIVVGLSRGVLLVEAQEKSGSLITAQLALDMGKDMFAIPGDIWNSTSSGCNNLLRSGAAKMVISSDDILEEYNLLQKKIAHKDILPLMDEKESKIYSLLSLGALEKDEITTHLNIPSNEVSMKLSLLELKKCIQKDISGKYSLL